MSDESFAAAIVLLGGVYFILEGLRLLLWFIFSRKTFMSWWTDTPVEGDPYEMYTYTYNFRGNPYKWTLNMKWVHRKMEEGTLGTTDKISAEERAARWMDEGG